MSVFNSISSVIPAPVQLHTPCYPFQWYSASYIHTSNLYLLCAMSSLFPVATTSSASSSRSPLFSIRPRSRLPSDRGLATNLQVATATAALVWLIWRFRHEWWEVRDLARSQRRRQNGRSGSKLDLFRVYYEAFASFDWAITTDSTASIISSDSLSSRTTVVTPSFALSSVCLAYAPTVADFPWVSYLLISKGILLITSVTTTATTVNLGGCIHDDGDSFCFSDDDWTPRIQTTSRIIRPPYIYRDM